jgi:hypothetical protein
MKLPVYFPPGGKLAPMPLPNYGLAGGGSAPDMPVPYDVPPARDDAADLMRMIPEKLLSVFEKDRRMQRDGQLLADGASQAQSRSTSASGVAAAAGRGITHRCVIAPCRRERMN